MSSHSLLLVDLSQVPSSFSELYVFLDNQLVIKSPEADNELVTEVSRRLAAALDQDTPEPLTLGKYALAKACAEERGLLEEYQSSLIRGEDEIDSWYEGFTTHEVLKAALNASRSENPYPDRVTARIDAFVCFDFKPSSANSEKHHAEAAQFISELEEKENGFAFSHLTAGLSLRRGMARLRRCQGQTINDETLKVGDIFDNGIRYNAPAVFSFQMETHGCDNEEALQQIAAGLLERLDPRGRPFFLEPDCARDYRESNLTVYVARNDNTGDIDPRTITIKVPIQHARNPT